MSNFGENLCEIMKEKKLSTIDIKNLIGISTTQTGRYLSGNYEPTLKNAIKISNFFNYSLDFLLGLDDIPNRYEKFNHVSFEKFIERYHKLMKDNNIDFAVDVYPFYGSDVDVTLGAGYDIGHGLIGAGVYASHGYERSHKDGVENTLKLLVNYCK